ASALVLLGLDPSGTTRAADVPTPESHLGFRPGADYRLAGWSEVLSYFRKVDEASDRVAVSVLGKSTEGRDLIAAVVSSPATIGDVSKYQNIQERLHDPRRFQNEEEAAEALEQSKPVVVITCSIHSSETASTLMATELLHELATGDDPGTLEILEKTILVLVPSANPDGVDKVATWYEKTKGQPWEGSGMIELYHKYAGHDTNRDWFMVNLDETRALSRMLYRAWFPTMLYDVHQMGSAGARLFVPPFYDPINPNLDPRVHQGIFTIGAHMAADLAAAGKRGVLTNAMYDNWWNGGNRTVPQRHNVVGVLTEAASVKMATPIFLEKSDLKGATRGFPDHKPAVNFVDPWPGGWWRLRDIVEYELICARSILTLAARYRDQFQRNLLAMAREAVQKGGESPPHAWIVPNEQRDPGAAWRLVRALHDTGVEVLRATEPFEAAGARFPAGSWILPAAQPYRAHLKDMMERQNYPNRLTAGGKAEPPYDVAGWTLPLQMGVQVVRVDVPFVSKGERVERVEPPQGSIETTENPARYVLTNQSNDDFTLLDKLLEAGVSVDFVPLAPSWSADGSSLVTFRATPLAKSVLDEVLPTVSSKVLASSDARDPGNLIPMKRRRVALYQPWMPSMDEGWTRLVLERFRLPYTTVHNAEVRAGRLIDRHDVLLIPSISPRTLAEGYDPGETDPRYVGGLGQEGVAALREFLDAGGRIDCLDDSCEYVIEQLNLPVKDVLKGLPTSEFYAPGSILRAVQESSARFRPALTSGAPREVAVYFDRSKAFEVTVKGSEVTSILRYADANPLESGWLLGPAKLAGKSALMEVTVGKGSVVLFGFRPQHRGQTYGTFRLPFNALYLP
ncbi:MAG: M14 metallopeptidase family protein, partial [Isosphaeraceae bacterium]